MPYVQVDPSQIQFDSPDSTSAVPTGFVPVDLSKIQFDKPGLMSRIGGALAGRLADAAQAEKDYQAGKITLPESMLRTVGAAGGGAGDIMGQTVAAAIPQTVKDAASSGAKSWIQNFDPNLPKEIQGFGQGVQSLEAQYPRATENLKAAGNVLNIPVAAKAMEGIAGAGKSLMNKAMAVEDVGTNLPGILGDTSSMPPKTYTAADVKNAGSLAFQKADSIGGILSPTFTNKTVDILEGAKIRPIANTVLTKEASAVNDALGEYSPLRGMPLTLDDYHALDSSLGDKAAQAFVSGNTNQGRIIAGAQDKIRSMLNGLSPEDVGGGKEGFDVLTKDAIPLWATQARMQDIEKIIDRANMMDNPSTAMRTGFRNLAINGRRMASYPADVQKLIRRAANTGNVDDLLGIVGSRLNPIAAAAGGDAASVITANITSKAGRGIRNYLQNQKASNVISALADQVRPQIEKYGSMSAADVVGSPIAAPPPINPANANLGIGSYKGKYRPSLKDIMQMPPTQARQAMQALKVKP